MKYIDIVNKIPGYELVGDDCKIFAKDYLDYVSKYRLVEEKNDDLTMKDVVNFLNQEVNETVKISGTRTSGSRPLASIKMKLEAKKKAQNMLDLLEEYC
jgi:hypothetical protein